MSVTLDFLLFEWLGVAVAAGAVPGNVRSRKGP
jgi:hypothetical protein